MKSTPANVETVLISEAKTHFQAAQVALRKGCEHALLTGLRLIALHSATSGDGHGGDRKSISSVSRGHLKKGFEGALEEIGIPRPTAYRWMDATHKACMRATLVFEDDDITIELPEAGTPRWEQWEAELRKVAQGMSLNRLLLGGSKRGTEENRYDALVSAEEVGQAKAAELLQGVAEGRYTLVQAVRALGSIEAYEQLRAEGGEKVRKDPVYLTYDGESGAIGGLLPKALVTLQNGCKKWSSYTPTEQAALRKFWQAIREELPDELFTAARP